MMVKYILYNDIQICINYTSISYMYTHGISILFFYFFGSHFSFIIFSGICILFSCLHNTHYTFTSKFNGAMYDMHHISSLLHCLLSSPLPYDGFSLLLLIKSLLSALYLYISNSQHNNFFIMEDKFV